MRENESEAEIRTAAYFLWQARGRVLGQDELDWNAAKLLIKRPSPVTSPPYNTIEPALVHNSIAGSHSGHDELFRHSTRWIELAVHPRAIFDCDRNRHLHFDEGFLCTSHRIFKDQSIVAIGPFDHFPYWDLAQFRRATNDVIAAYRAGMNLPPPIFFCPARDQLEILDGVHRCIAAYELALPSNEPCGFSPADYRIWVGFDGDKFDAPHMTHQLWETSLCAGTQGSRHVEDLS